jgi:plastocyanin
MLVLVILVVGCTTTIVEESEEAPTEETTQPEEEAQAPAVKEVIIDSKRLEPEELTISEGETVTWRKIDDRSHRLIENNGLFESGDQLYTGNTFSFTFDEAGTYKYIDSAFGTRGKIIVE